MKYILILIFLLGLLTPVVGQNDSRRQIIQQRLEAQRIAFITNKLELTPEESQQFWPLFNQYKQEEKTLRESVKRPGSLSSASDEAIEAYLLAELNMEEKQIDLKRQYLQKLKEVLPIRKIARLNMAERQFKEWVIDQMKELQSRRQQRKNYNQ